MTEQPELGPDDERLRALGVDPAPVVAAAHALVVGFGRGGTALTFGNGGSAAHAQHFAAELVGRFEDDQRPGLPAVALTTDGSALTAIGNDYGFEDVFARQVRALGRRNDVAVAFSTSGRSANVLVAVDAARDAGMTTIGVCGLPGSPLCERVDLAIVAGRERAAEVQEIHTVIQHALCRMVERLVISPGPFALHPPGTVVGMDDLLELRAGWKAARRVMVWTNGAFDALHAGHLASLQAAAELGDVLVVGVNSDATVSRVKGEGRPLVPAAERARLLAALRMVDHVVVFDDDTPEQALATLMPEIHCKGSDYRPPDGKPIPEREIVESYGGRIEFLPIVPGHSTTQFLDRAGYEG